MTETGEYFNNKIFGINNRKSKRLKIKKRNKKLGLDTITCTYGSCNILNPITNVCEYEHSVTSHRKFTQSRTYANRGKYRTYIRSKKIDEEFITPTIFMRQRNFWDCEAYKPKLFVYN